MKMCFSNLGMKKLYRISGRGAIRGTGWRVEANQRAGGGEKHLQATSAARRRTEGEFFRGLVF
jgi:hypothetical protein